MVSLKDRLTEILIKNKLITQEQLNLSIEEQKKKGGTLSEIIIGLKFIKESDLISVLSEGLNFPLIDLKRFRLDPEIVKLIPRDVSQRYVIIAISKIGDIITLAMADPLNIFAIDHVEALTGYKINPIISPRQDILTAIEASYPENSKDMVGEFVKEMSTSSIELIKDDSLEAAEQEVGRISEDAPVVKITDWILEEGVNKKSSDILIEPFEKKLRVRFRIDGVLQEAQTPPKNLQ
jgi:type IV pilus assembly protein PilB